MNGVDVADVTRSFSEDDWHKLGDAGRRYVNAERARNRGSGNDDNCNVSDVNTGGAGNNADNAGDDTATGSTNGNRGSQNGTRFGANGGRGRGGRNASAVTSCVRRINRVSMTEDYDAVKDVPVATCATAVTDDSGETIIFSVSPDVVFWHKSPAFAFESESVATGRNASS